MNLGSDLIGSLRRTQVDSSTIASVMTRPHPLSQTTTATPLPHHLTPSALHQMESTAIEEGDIFAGNKVALYKNEIVDVRYAHVFTSRKAGQWMGVVQLVTLLLVRPQSSAGPFWTHILVVKHVFPNLTSWVTFQLEPVPTMMWRSL